MATRTRTKPTQPFQVTASYPQTGASAKDAPTPPDYIRGRVILYAEKAGITVTLRHWALPQVLSERTGGWEVIDRPNAQPVVHWTGYKPIKIRLTLLADGLLNGPASVDETLHYLRQLTVRGQLKTPPSLIVIGKVPYARGLTGTPTRWVIDDLEIEETAHVPVSGQVARAKITVDLLQYSVPADDTAVDPAGAAALKRRGPFVWKATDTLHDLAERYLGDAKYYNSIRNANPQIKSWSNLKPGTKYWIPAKGSVS